jgi:hypothetical protein
MMRARQIKSRYCHANGKPSGVGGDVEVELDEAVDEQTAAAEGRP